MPWLKVSDDAGMHPMVLAPLTDSLEGVALDPYLWANAIAGVVQRCATMSAGFTTDYFVADATVFQVAGPQWRRVAEAAERAGYWQRIEVGGRPGWLIVDDSDHFVHIRLKDELEWERQRKRDNSNPRLTVPVRLRDGDGCRYCGHIVDWRARRGNRMGTYDHRVPGQPAKSPEDLRVACGSCNAHRGDRADADGFCPPFDPPVAPYYGEHTVAFLAENGFTVPLSTVAPQRPRNRRDPARTASSDPTASGAPQSTAQRPGNPPDTAPATPTPSGHRALKMRPADIPQIPPATPEPPGPRVTDQHEPPVAARSVDPAGRQGTESRSPGRERDGPGSGREHLPVPTTSRKRRSRGKRGRPSTAQPRDPDQR